MNNPSKIDRRLLRPSQQMMVFGEHVRLHGAPLATAVGAVRAPVRLLSAVDVVVVTKPRLVQETHPTHGAVVHGARGQLQLVEGKDYGLVTRCSARWSKWRMFEGRSKRSRFRKGSQGWCK